MDLAMDARCTALISSRDKVCVTQISRNLQRNKVQSNIRIQGVLSTFVDTSEFRSPS